MYLVFNPDTNTLDTRDGVPSLADGQAIVGGYIEPVDLWSDDRGSVSLWVNEEGLMYGLPSTVGVLNAEYYPNGWVGFGAWYISRTDMRTGETVPMTAEDIARIRFGNDGGANAPGDGFTSEGLRVPLMEIV